MEEKLENVMTLIGEISSLKTEIARLEKAVAVPREEMVEETKEPEVILEPENSDNDIELDSVGDECAFYYKQISSFELSGNDDEDKDELREMLPLKSNPNYKELYLRIIAELKKELNIFRIEIESTKSFTSKEELELYYNELQSIDKKLSLVKEINIEKELPIESRPKNKLVFLNSATDRIYALDDVSGIPVDYYDRLHELFESIIDGSFKNVRYFHSTNDKLNGVIEVKEFKIRVLFDRVGPHTYAIIAAFVKKTDKDKSYMEFLANRIQVYRNRRSKLVENAKSEEYIEEQEKITEELFKMMGYTPSSGRGVK